MKKLLFSGLIFASLLANSALAISVRANFSGMVVPAKGQKSFDFNLSDTASVLDLKKEIARKVGLPMDQADKLMIMSVGQIRSDADLLNKIERERLEFRVDYRTN